MSEPPRSSAWKIALVILLGIALGVGGAALWRWRQSQNAPATTPPIEPEKMVRPPPAPAVPAVSMTNGDTLLRQLGPLLSNASELAKWLAETDILRRLVAAVNLIAEGNSPRAVLGFLNPQGPFEVVDRYGKLYASNKSYARYELVTRVLTSIDTAAAGRAYRQLKPYLDSAFSEIGRPGKPFEEVIREAIDRLLETPIPQTEAVLQPKGLGYAYADPQLEGLSAAQKHLLRMGPENAQAIQAWLKKVKPTLSSAAAAPPLSDAGK